MERQDYEDTYDELWRDIVENPDGSLNVDQVKRELHDFATVMEEVSKVYDHITDGRISYLHTLASEVIAVVDELEERRHDEAICEALAGHEFCCPCGTDA